MFDYLYFKTHPSYHPDPSLQKFWNITQLGLLIFPINSAVGAIILILTAIIICKNKLKTIISRRLNWGFALLSIWLVITVFFAYNHQYALVGLINLLPYFLIFVAFTTLLQTTGQLRQIAWIIVITSIPIAIIGLGQIFLGWHGDNLLIQAIFCIPIFANGNPVGRMSSIFSYANILAAYALIVFTLGMGLLMEQGEIIKNRFKKGKVNLQLPINYLEGQLLILIFAEIGMAIVLILTSSRNAWIVALLASLAFAVYQGWRWLVGIVSAIAASIFGAAFAPSPIKEWLRFLVPAYFWARLNDQMYPNRPIAELRTTQWQFAWSMTQQRPLTGWGLRNFTLLYEAKMKLWLGHPHNLLLMLMSETGIVSTLLLCSLVAWILGRAILLLNKFTLEYPQDKLILFTYLIAFTTCILFNTVDVTMFDLRVNTLGWLLLAGLYGIVTKNSQEDKIKN